ncbi:hypothetical protein DRO32_00090 [Candidatus Bathyarchaeota archaeon]|nr:MAG: hypothetical protein DRO32_00090 [Candidatus Bathyarchaeota archaeon]
MSSSRELEAVNNLIRYLSHVESMLRRAVSSLKREEEYQMRRLEEGLRKGLVNDLEGIIYADHMKSIEGTLKVFKNLLLRVSLLKNRLMMVRTALLLFDSLHSELAPMKKAMRDLGGVIKPVEETIRGVCNDIDAIVNDVSLGLRELEKVVDLSGLLGGRAYEVLDEVLSKLRAEVEEGMPEPAGAGVPAPEACEPVALAASQAREDGDAHAGEGRGTDELDKAVLSYVEKNGGKINLSKCARELGVSVREVLEALGRLADKNLIRLGG